MSESVESLATFEINGSLKDLNRTVWVILDQSVCSMRMKLCKSILNRQWSFIFLWVTTLCNSTILVALVSEWLYGFHVKSGNFALVSVLYHMTSLLPYSGNSLLFQVNKIAANGKYIKVGSVIYWIVTVFEFSEWNIWLQINLCIILTNKDQC